MKNVRIVYVMIGMFLVSAIYQCSSEEIENDPPVIKVIESIPESINVNDECVLTCYAVDDEELSYVWNAKFGEFPNGKSANSVTWKAPIKEGEYFISVRVSDFEFEVGDSVNIIVKKESQDSLIKNYFRIPNSNIVIQMVKIFPESFYMGAPGTTGAGDDEAPKHLVNLSHPFWIGIYEVTQEQWTAVMGAKSFTNQSVKHPADNVSWYNAKAFTITLNNLENDSLWRLPTEAEWEYCSRAGHSDTRFWYGNDDGYVETNNHSWNSTNSNGHTHEVGTTLAGMPNPYGLWDMGGNVWEWCEDWYHWGYIDAPNDGSAWVVPAGNRRIIRGGSFWENGRRTLSNLRSLAPPNGSSPTLGFRLVRDIR